jgi:AmmeMemoRadiSam system protein A
VELNKKQKEILLKIARDSVFNFIKFNKIYEPIVKDERLKKTEGAFVSIYNKEELRGCIGRIISDNKALCEIVRDMAIAACFEDFRFKPVSEEELDFLRFEISVLSVPKLIDNWKKIKLGKHGVIIKKGSRSGVFLPQVAYDTGWSLEEFLSQLCLQKTGLAEDAYKNDKEAELYIFKAQVFRNRKFKN